jgi:hypothetical protein
LNLQISTKIGRLLASVFLLKNEVELSISLSPQQTTLKIWRIFFTAEVRQEKKA